MKKEQKPICPYCNGIVQMLETSNHIIGCNLEAIAQILRYRGEEREASKLDEIASRIK